MALDGMDFRLVTVCVPNVCDVDLRFIMYESQESQATTRYLTN